MAANQNHVGISIFFKNTFISVFGRKYHSTQSVKKL